MPQPAWLRHPLLLVSSIGINSYSIEELLKLHKCGNEQSSEYPYYDLLARSRTSISALRLIVALRTAFTKLLPLTPIFLLRRRLSCRRSPRVARPELSSVDMANDSSTHALGRSGSPTRARIPVVRYCRMAHSALRSLSKLSPPDFVGKCLLNFCSRNVNLMHTPCQLVIYPSASLPWNRDRHERIPKGPILCSTTTANRQIQVAESVPLS